MPASLIEISVEKSNKPNSYWIVEKDLATGATAPRHLGTSAFSDNFYRHFIKENNTIAGKAAEFGIDLGVEYTAFYQVGMRVSQQLDGSLRDRTMEQYEALRDSLQGNVLRGLLQVKTSKRNTELDQLVAGEETKKEMSGEDLERLRTLTGQLKAIPFKDFKRDRFGERRFEERLTYISLRDENKGLLENYWHVQPALRVDYVAVIKFTDLNGITQSYMEYEEEKLKNVLTELGTANSKIYLQALQTELRRDAHKGYQFFNDTALDISDLSPEHRDFFLAALVRAQSAGITRFVEAIPFAVARLHEKHDVQTATDITEQAFRLFEKGTAEGEVLNFIDRHLR